MSNPYKVGDWVKIREAHVKVPYCTCPGSDCAKSGKAKYLTSWGTWHVHPNSHTLYERRPNGVPKSTGYHPVEGDWGIVTDVTRTQCHLQMGDAAGWIHYGHLQPMFDADT